MSKNNFVTGGKKYAKCITSTFFSKLHWHAEDQECLFVFESRVHYGLPLFITKISPHYDYIFLNMDYKNGSHVNSLFYM